MKNLLSILLILGIYSCKKDSFITSSNAQLTITADTLKYDTVFTTSGSVYQSFRIINTNSQHLRISSVSLESGANSVFKMNVDGQSGSQFSNLDIAPNDSLYVFVQVNIDPAAGQIPFIIRDSIRIKYNNSDRLVQLEAWGQNAHFLRNATISGSETWINDLPYVILGSLSIASGSSLNINKGCRIYVHANAPIVVDGTLVINGDKDSLERVVFQGDRLDAPYRDFPAAWPGIFFRESARDNQLNYAIFKNAYQAIGITGPSQNGNPKLVLNECVIDNAFDAGIISLNSDLRVRNSLITNCGKNIVIAHGGNYDFNHCTVVTYGNKYIDHKNPVLSVSNSLNSSVMPLSAVFRNCIFWGENGLVENEVVVLKSGNTSFNVTFDHNLWKVLTLPLFINTPIGMINNQQPLFDSINTSDRYFDFRLKQMSPAVNKGVTTAASIDLDGKPRPVGLPDLGSFEKQ